jgi:hypothetical protein
MQLIHTAGGYWQIKHVASNRGEFRMRTMAGWRQTCFTIPWSLACRLNVRGKVWWRSGGTGSGFVWNKTKVYWAEELWWWWLFKFLSS